MNAPSEPSPHLRPAWGPIAFLCLAAVYLLGFAAVMMALCAHGWFA